MATILQPTAGLDVGALWTKAAVCRDGALAAWRVAPTGCEAGETAEQVLGEALAACGLSAQELAGVFATGAGKAEVERATGRASEVLCAARGAQAVHPGARGVLDLGGESTRALRLDERGAVADFALNDKCAAGTGVFLDAMARLMGVAIEQMGPLSLTAVADVAITSMCVAFAESEVVSQVHRQTPKRDIVKGIHKSIATRVLGLLRRVDLGPEVLAIGGLARNVGITTCLEELMGHRLLLPPEPQLVSALGAALLAGEQEATP